MREKKQLTIQLADQLIGDKSFGKLQTEKADDPSSKTKLINEERKLQQQSSLEEFS